MIKYIQIILIIILIQQAQATCDSVCGENQICQDTTCIDKCASDDDCSDSNIGSYCKRDTGECVECVYDEECTVIDSVQQICNPTDNTCVGCHEDFHCDGQVCHPDNNTCVDCIADCSLSSEICNTSTNLCVQCLSNTDCENNTVEQGQYCNLSTNECIPCQDNNDCAVNEFNKQCKLSETEGVSNQCVECLYTSNCPKGQLCDTSTNSCEYCLNCGEATPACREEDNTCVECVLDTDCSNALLPYCESTSNTCVECDTGKTDLCTGIDQCNMDLYECQPCGGSCSDTEHCNSNVICSECLINTHCSGSTPACDTSGESSFSCVECTGDSDCSDPNPFCDSNICVECTLDTDCTNSLCSSLNTCDACGDGCDTQYCNSDGVTCVDCTEDSHCSGDSPACSSSGDSANTCVECTSEAHCTGDLTQCDTVNQVCVECLDDAFCTTIGAHLICTDNNECKDGSIGLECDDASECYDGLVCNTDAANTGEFSKAGTCRSCQRNESGCEGIFVCSNDYECVAGNEGSICTDDSECADRLECDTTSGTCKLCVTDSHCITQNEENQGYVCYQNDCYDGSTDQSCTDNGQCASGVCHSGQTSCQDCEYDSDCNIGEGFQDYVCTATFSCKDGSDGQSCTSDDQCLLSCVGGTTCGCSDSLECSDSQICGSSSTCKDGSDGQICTGNIDCDNFCNTESSLCVECYNDDSQCTGDSLQFCSDSDTCVECTQDLQCTNGKCISNSCVISTLNTDCDDDTDCDESSGHKCDVGSTDQCQLCTSDDDCSDPSSTYCHLSNRDCVECLSNDQCLGGTCDDNGSCQLGEVDSPCEVDDDCNNLICDISLESSTCQECYLNEHCANGVCESNQCIDGILDTDCSENGDSDCIDSLYCQNFVDSDNLCKECDGGETHICGDGLVCDITKYQCVECLDNDNCDGTLICTDSQVCKDGSNDQICDNDSECNSHCHEGICEDCSIHGHCEENYRCNNETQECVLGIDGNSCNNDSYCLNRCLVNQNICVECLDLNDCGLNQVCNASNICVDGSIDSSCVDQTECIDFCETTSGTCKICLQDSDCSNGYLCTDSYECVDGNLGESCQNDTYCINRCNLDSNICVFCVEEGDCPIKSEVCSDQNVCTNGTIGSDCQNSSECLGVCDDNISTCSACLSKTDCANSLVCDVKSNSDSLDNECVECFNDTHCTIGSCFENECRAECQTTDDCPDIDSPVCNESKVCVACSQSTDCYKFADTQICDPTTSVCIAELQIQDDCCDQPSDLVTNSNPTAVESFLEDSPIISLFFEIQTESYKQKLYFVQLLVDGVIMQPQSVDNSTLGELTINLDANNFQKGKNTTVKVYASYKNQSPTRRILQSDSTLIKFEKQVKLTDKSSIQGEQPVVTETEVKEETDYLYLYILIPVAIVFMLAIGLIAYKGGQKKQQKTIEQKTENKKQAKYVDTENLDLKDE